MSNKSKGGTKKEELFIRVYLSAFESDLIAKLSGNQLKVLLTICSYMDKDGKCWPTQEQLAEKSGVGKTTVNKVVNELLAIRFNGKPIISRKMEKHGPFRNSVYTVLPASQIAIFGGQVEKIDTGESTDTSTIKSTENESSESLTTTRFIKMGSN
ncbi:helix-turn-helix domain-containing protein [Neobacillus mesonae]|uniref:helix-turn-helix domain-containing protein n=1 Tax=Neobacillus mesonae TaxID=1193713 RepID=UPI00082CE1FF|nr:helix-turn-helix domain-containing protein [Neobacillus mesonae]